LRIHRLVRFVSGHPSNAHRCSVQCIHFQASWLHRVGRCGRICCRDSHGI
jgi:hypothetical protein